MSRGIVYNIQRMSTEDGPGVRTTVFLKGCPLRCSWCSNPESQKRQPQIMAFSQRCVACGACDAVCKHNAIAHLEGDKRGIYAAKCQNCQECAVVCKPEARTISGAQMDVDDVMRVIAKDDLFYHNSGGGVTIGGGEPTAGGEFFLNLLDACYEQGYHTTVDTCGYCSQEIFAEVLKKADLLLFDCKHMNAARHKELTGVDNVCILKNLQTALELKKDVRIRMPLLPKLNDSEENIAAMADFLIPLGKSQVDIMPYHAFGKSKYAALDWQYPDIQAYCTEEVNTIRNTFTKYGLTTHIA